MRTSTSRQPVDAYLRDLERRLRHEHRHTRALVNRWEGIDQLRHEFVTALADSDKRLHGDEILERLHWLALIGDGYVLDELIRMANPEIQEDPLHIDLLKHPFLRDEDVRRAFFQTLGALGATLQDADVDRVLGLMRILRRGLTDPDRRVRAAAAEAIGRSVKLHPTTFENFQLAVDPLIDLLFDPDWQVRREVVGALTELADPRALRALENHILREKDAHLRMITESSLKRLRDRLGHFRYVRKAVQQLRNRLSKTPSE